MTSSFSTCSLGIKCPRSLSIYPRRWSLAGRKRTRDIPLPPSTPMFVRIGLLFMNLLMSLSNPPGAAALALKAAGFDLFPACPSLCFSPANALLLPFRPIFHLTVI